MTDVILDEVLRSAEEDSGILDQALVDIRTNQKGLTAFLFSESMEDLLSEEKDLLLFGAMVIWTAYKQLGQIEAEIPLEEIEETEDAHWEVISRLPNGKFNERIDPFFEKKELEEPLAFIEDLLQPDETDAFTPGGRDMVFVALATWSSLLHQNLQD